MTKDEKIETLQKQLDMTNANYNILNKKYIELNLKIKHLLDGIEMIKHREYSDISQFVIENSEWNTEQLDFLVKYPCSRLGNAMDMLCDTLADFPYDLE